MKQLNTLTPENFTALMNWLSPNLDEAGKEYEQVRAGLIRFFHFRGCSEPEVLADETITRVAMKLSTFDMSNSVKTITYFYGFAKNIYREYLADRKKNESLNNSLKQLHNANSDREKTESEIELDCLENCLKKMPEEEKDLLLMYYSENKKKKILVRNELADKFNLKKGTLQTKVHRLKIEIRKCMEKCIKEKTL